jgi:hypothetical protein
VALEFELRASTLARQALLLLELFCQQQSNLELRPLNMFFKTGLGTVAHACNLSYFGSRDWNPGKMVMRPPFNK